MTLSFDLHKTPIASLAIIATLLALIAISILFPRGLGIAPSIVGLIAFISLGIHQKEWARPSRSIAMAIAAILTSAGLSYFWAYNPDFVLGRTGKLCLILGPSLLLLAVLSSLKALSPSFLKILFIGFFGTALAIFVIEGFFGYPLHYLTRDVAEGETLPLSTLNRASVILVACSFPLITLFKEKPALQWGILLLLFACLFLGKSQTAQLALLIGAAFYFSFPVVTQFFKQSFWTGLYVCIAALTLSLPWLIDLLGPHIIPLIQKGTLLFEASIPHRIEIWRNMSAAIFASPWLGYGIEATRFLEFDTVGEFAKGNNYLHPHCAILQIWIEFGLAGILLALGLIGFLMKHIYSLPDAESQRLALASFMVLFSVAITGYGLWQSWLIGLFVLIVALNIIVMRAIK